MAKSRQFCKLKSVCVGWLGQHLDFAYIDAVVRRNERKLCLSSTKVMI